MRHLAGAGAIFRDVAAVLDGFVAQQKDWIRQNGRDLWMFIPSKRGK